MQEEASVRHSAAICPFLEGLVEAASSDAVGTRWTGQGSCAALESPISLSNRQLELACLNEQHLVCPRYVRGRLANTPHSPNRRLRSLPAARRPVLAGALMLVVSAGIAAGYLLSGGGLMLPASSPALVALASSGASTDRAPEPSPALTRSPDPSPSASVSAMPIATPTPNRSPAGSPDPSPEGAVDALFPEGGRWDHLVECPDTPDCYMYTVQRNDTLYAIGATFHVPLRTIRALNPGLTSAAILHPGQKLKLPTPTP